MIAVLAENDFARGLFLLLLFGLVILGVLATMSAVIRRATMRAQMQQIARSGHSQHTATSLRTQAVDSGWARLAARIEAAGLSLSDSDHDRLALRMRAAGYASPAAPRIYTLVRLVLVFVLPLAYLALAYSADEQPSFLKVYVIGAVLALLGLYLPNLYVRARADRRREDIINGFPDCLDLLLVCVESGLGIEAAIDRVGREMVLSRPLVAEILSAATLQLRAGASRDEVFRRMGDSTGVDEIRSFATLLIQSDKLGTSVATTLRVYAAEMREKRQMRAEEKAHRLPVLISIPLVVCMLPVMIGVLMLPAIVRIAREIVPLLAGG